jgi:DNA-binding beta-propeller fold protein YncE
MTRRLIALTVGLMLVTFFSLGGTASAAGGPILPGAAYGPEGVTAPGSADRYVTLFAGRQPLVARVRQDGGQVLRTRSFGQFAIPAVTLDGSAGGLSADGSTMVLAPPRSGLRRAETTLKVIDARQLHVRDRITLAGSFTFDAISPDGSRVYLVEYLSPTNPTRYEVRAYDTRSGRLLRDPIVDPNEPPGEMRGYPITRAVSPAGRWAYTLYDGGGDHPFIHALDTVGGRAVCIDVHALADHPALRNVFVGNAGRFGLAVSDNGGEVTVLDRDVPVAYVDTRTFEVSEPTAPADGGGFPWVLVILAAAAFVAAALTLGLRRRRHDVAAGGAR